MKLTLEPTIKPQPAAFIQSYYYYHPKSETLYLCAYDLNHKANRLVKIPNNTTKSHNAFATVSNVNDIISPSEFVEILPTEMIIKY